MRARPPLLALLLVGLRRGLLAAAVTSGCGDDAENMAPTAEADDGLCAGGTCLSGASLLAVGHAHSCVTVAGGEVRCWGTNLYDQLGNGSSADSPAPVVVTGVAGATALSAGSVHTCVLGAGGGARCWGYNGSGQLGDGSYSNAPLAVPVMNIAGAAAIATGDIDTCVLVAGGGVRCWGDNQFGKLGNADDDDSPLPVAVAGIVGATALAAGGYHSCAVVAGGAVRCWGLDDRGQLGDGGGVTASSFAPVAVAGLLGATAVVTGDYHTCALRQGQGDVWCWGANDAGQLGDGTTTDRDVPVAVTGLTSLAVKELAAGVANTCALTASGTVYCWGSNVHGQLGDGTTRDSATPVKAAGIKGATAVRTSVEHTCAIVAGNRHSVRCWGSNDWGQLGNGTKVASPLPVAVVVAAP